MVVVVVAVMVMVVVMVMVAVRHVVLAVTIVDKVVQGVTASVTATVSVAGSAGTRTALLQGLEAGFALAAHAIGMPPRYSATEIRPAGTPQRYEFDLTAAIERAKIDSPRGTFTLSKAHNPIQDIYLREVQGGQNKVLSTPVKSLADPARGCKM